MARPAKTGVSLSAELPARAQRALDEGDTTRVTPDVAGAIAQKAKLDDLASLLEEISSEMGGSLTTRERAAADRALGR